MKSSVELVRSKMLLIMVVVVGTLGFSMGPVAKAAATPHVSVGLPGTPPVWAGVVAYVAKDEGYFKKFGVDVTIRPFASGAGAARAVAAGSVDASLSPAAPVVKMIANAAVPLVGIWGMEHPDWMLGTTTDRTSCKDLKGQAVGVDSVGGARWIQLIKVLHYCKMKPSEVQVVSLSSNVAQAMVAGTLSYGILHQSDVPVIEHQGHKKVHIVKTIQQISPDNEYLLWVTTPKVIRNNRQGLVRMLAAMIRATKFMHNPANYDAVAKIAIKNNISDANSMANAVAAIKDYDNLHFWPLDTAGMSPVRIKKTVAVQVKVGGIKKGSPVPTVSDIVTTDLWKAAWKLQANHS